MSDISEWSSRECFVWAVERPVESKPRYSPKFTVTNQEIKLGLYWECKNKKLFIRCSSCKPDGKVFSLKCKFTVHVEDRKRIVLPLSRTTSLSYDLMYDKRGYRIISSYKLDDIIWSFSETDILKAIPDFYENGLLIFLVTIDSGDKKYAFDIKSPTEPKSIQTEVQEEETAIQNALPCLKSLSTDLLDLLQNPDSEPDVVLVCGDHSVRAHKNVLSARSKVLAATLRSDLSEGRTGQIEIRDMDCDTFDQLVRYIYTAELPELIEETARHFYEAADRYAIGSLMKRCASFLEKNLTPENAWEMLALADVHSDGDFKEKVMEYITKEKIPLKDDHWQPFSESHPKLAIEVLHRVLLQTK